MIQKLQPQFKPKPVLLLKEQENCSQINKTDSTGILSLSLFL